MFACFEQALCLYRWQEIVSALKPTTAEQRPKQAWKLLDQCIWLLLFFLLALIPAGMFKHAWLWALSSVKSSWTWISHLPAALGSKCSGFLAVSYFAVSKHHFQILLFCSSIYSSGFCNTGHRLRWRSHAELFLSIKICPTQATEMPWEIQRLHTAQGAFMAEISLCHETDKEVIKYVDEPFWWLMVVIRQKKGTDFPSQPIWLT